VPQKLADLLLDKRDGQALSVVGDPDRLVMDGYAALTPFPPVEVLC
jgi:hypothetical protein